METGGGSRRRRSSSSENVDSPNLRDFLRLKEDNGGGGGGLTLSAVLSIETRPSPAQVNRTLLDVIRDEPNDGGDRKSWKIFKDKLRLRRAGAAWTSSVPTPTSDIPLNRMISRPNSTRFTEINPDNQSNQPELSSSSSISIGGGENGAELMNSTQSNNRAAMMRRNSGRIPSLSATQYGRGVEGQTPFSRIANNSDEAVELRAEDAEEEEGGGEEREAGEEEAPVRMSLMSLLAETDREMGLDGSSYMMEDEEEDEEEEEERGGGSGGGGGGGGEYNNCCVCMVRHKGSAFIPCGHTFCRLCSRELWVQRGNCPLCNGFILEILDIF